MKKPITAVFARQITIVASAEGRMRLWRRSNLYARDCFVAMLLAMTVFVPSAYACPACKEAVAKLGEAWTALGFNWSILFMITIPLLLVASFGTAIFLLVRKNQSHS